MIDPPDDRQVVELDAAVSALDELETLAGEQFDDVLDVVDGLGQTPAWAADEVIEHFHLDRPPRGGWFGLIEKINVYGRALEYDLWVRGDRLSAYFLGRHPWDELLRLADRLPMGSQYYAALADDDELAAQIAARHGPPSKRKKGSGRPPLPGWTREVAYLHRIDNQLRRLEWAMFAAQATKRSSPPRAAKGPQTADDRYEQADFMREHEEIVGKVLKRKGGSKRPPGMPAPEAVRGAVLLDAPTVPAPIT